MKYPHPLPRFLVVGLALLLGASALGRAEAPNFIVIMGEAQGWTSSSVSLDDAHPEARSELARTPNLEKLAAGGMRFANFHAASPRCTPTRAAFLTGKNPAALHMTFVGGGMGGRESSFDPVKSLLRPAEFISELPGDAVTFVALLQGAGYATAHFGKWHLGKMSPAKHGFEESDGATNNDGPDHVEDPNPKQAFGLTERGLDFIAREEKIGKPFFLQLSHYPGRGGLDARPATYEAIRRRTPDERNLRRVGAAAVTEDMDATIGLILAKLEQSGLAARTYVIYTSDHGALGREANYPLANGKGSVWEGGLRIPLIVRGPGVRAGICTHTAATTVDLFRTILALAGLRDSPDGLEGGNLVQVLKSEPNAVVTRLRAEFVVHAPHYDRGGQNPAAALYLGHLKLIRSFETGGVQLFDLDQDLIERDDLALSRRLEAKELNQRLDKYLEEVKASIPTRNVPAGSN